MQGIAKQHLPSLSFIFYGLKYILYVGFSTEILIRQINSLGHGTQILFDSITCWPFSEPLGLYIFFLQVAPSITYVRIDMIVLK